jgi:hypothetical protein
LLSDFLHGSSAAVVVEDGAIAFDLADSKYSVSGITNVFSTCGQMSAILYVACWTPR